MNEQKVEILDLLAILYVGRRLILGGTLIICALATGFSYVLTEQYESTVQILPPKEQKKGFGFADLLSDLPIPALRLGEKGTPADIFIATLKSPTTHRRMIERFNLMEQYESETMTDAVETLAELTTVEKSEEGTILVTVLDESPEQAAAMTNHYLVVLDSTNKRLTQTGAKDRLQFIRDLLDRESQKLGVVMEKLQEFQSEHNAISIENQAGAVINAAAAIQMEIIELTMTRNIMVNQGFTSTHPKVREIEEKIDQRNQALIILRDGKNIPSARKAGKQLQLDENLFLPLRDIPEVALEYANIEKEVLVQKALMQMLLQQEAEALIESSNTTSTVQVLDYAVPAEEHARPRRFLIVFIAGVLSFFSSTTYTIGIGYLQILKQRWDANYKDTVS
jgi:uncharacterized protein involved in exopolysaccharide biosynthesis